MTRAASAPVTTTATTTIAAALRDAAARLAATSDTPRLDAELLMAHAVGTSRSELLLRHMRDPVPDGFDALIARRAADEPVAYILGACEFYGIALAVGPAVLIPRGDSETLIETARTTCAAPPASILDLGTGSGALLIAALHVWQEAKGVGIDSSPAALAFATRNAARQLGPEHWTMRQADWNAPGWHDGLGRFDLVLANPPYVETDAALSRSVRDFEPAGALFAGSEGLDAYRALIPQIPALLTPVGIAIVEIGASQSDAVTAIATHAGLAAVLHHDLAGRPRALALSQSS